MMLTRAFLVLTGVLGGATVLSAQSGPDRPREPLTVYVFTNEADDPDAETPTSKVVEEVVKRVRDRKKWFVVATRPDRAEISLQILNYTLEERMRQRLETRVDVTGTSKEWVDYTWTEEHHFIEARAELPGGSQSLVEGTDQRERGGSLKRAATHLAQSLEELCQKRYYEIAEHR